MAKVSVPDRHKDAVGNLLHLSGEQVRTLSVALDTSDQRYMTIETLLRDSGIEDPANALQALASLELARRQFNLTESDVADSLAPVGNEQPANLWPLLNTTAVRRFAKAIDLRNSYEKILADSRVISDIRPVFPDEGEIPRIVDAAMVNHTLKLTYFPGERGLPGEIHIAVDTVDLKNLREQIDRALEKESAARALIEKGGAIVLEPLVNIQ